MKFKIPWLPLSGLMFYLGVFFLWSFDFIPPPNEIFLFLEGLYNSYGWLGLFIASFLESIVYLGLYFPGSFIVALAVFLSDGSFSSLISISVIVAVALTITAFINYFLGKHFVFKKSDIDNKHSRLASKGLFLSMIHPNSLAFYFFNEGIKRQSILKIIFVPIVMIPYGLLFAYVLYFFKRPLRQALEEPYIMISVLLLWLLIALIFHKKRRK